VINEKGDETDSVFTALAMLVANCLDESRRAKKGVLMINIEEVAENIATMGATFKAVEPTTEETASALIAIAPAMQAAWEQVLADDTVWAMRAQHYGKLRTWWLRWQLRRKQWQ
jgi:hypothetical protein